MTGYLAILPDGSKWYRGKVVDALNGCIEVEYIEYAFSMTLKNTHANLLRMKAKFSKVASYAVRVALKNVKLMNETNSLPEQAAVDFAKHLVGR